MIPKPIVDFLQSVQVNIEGYLVASIVNVVEADFEEWLVDNYTTFSQHRLEHVFSEYGRVLYPFSMIGRRKIKKKHGA